MLISTFFFFFFFNNNIINPPILLVNLVFRLFRKLTPLFDLSIYFNFLRVFSHLTNTGQNAS